MLKLMAILFCIIVGFNAIAYANKDEFKNFCTNGGFEILNRQKQPADWGGFAGTGASFGISKDAYSGEYAFFLKSISDAVVGLNRAQSALIPLVRGIARFWYKAVLSEVGGKNLQVCIIAMKESGEDEVAREIYTVPFEHVGDGQWHFIEVEFDFTQREEARWIHFAPRINETTSDKAPGEFLLDDIQITMIGPKLQIKTFGAAEPLVRVGEDTICHLVIENIGDQNAVNPEVQLSLPSGMAISDGNAENFELETIKPGQNTELSWPIIGEKSTSGAIAAIINSSVSSFFYLTVMDRPESALSLSNKHVSAYFPKTEHGYGIFSLLRPGTDVIKSMAQASMFGSLSYRTSSGSIENVPLFADDIERKDRKYIFSKKWNDADDVLWNFEFIFELSEDKKWVDVTYKAASEKKREILAFYGPVLYSKRQARNDAVFPGLEYLEGDEISSSILDIAPPKHIRRVPHPNKITIPLMAVSENLDQSGTIITGMMWDAKQKWHNGHDLPSALFASPNWFQGMENYDVMGIFVPSVPNWVGEDHTQATNAYEVQPGEQIKIEVQLFSNFIPEANTSAVYSVPYWIEKYGLIEPLDFPRKSLKDEIVFSLEAYMDTLWMPDEELWHNTLDWDPWPAKANAQFAHQLWFAAKLLPDAPERDKYMRRAELTFKKLGINLGQTLPFYIGKLDEIYPRFKGAISRLIQTQREDGSWRFDPDQLNATDKIHHQDYHKLGKKGEAEIGLCANKAHILLHYARMTGDKSSLEAGLKTLDFMKQFRIPRAAQVWEVPVHTPDILASAHAIQAYLEAYRITDDRSHLDMAVYWAFTGLPFVYLWHNSDMPYMLYASIPVFGATWFTHSWFGVAVQWNGLDYAYALFDLAEYDSSLPWDKIARGLTISGLYQQETSEKYRGMYPDSYNFMDRSTSAWKLAPSLIIRNLFEMMGYPAEPVTEIIRKGDEKIHISAAMPIKEPELSDSALKFSLDYPLEMDGYVMIAGMKKPDQKAVMVDWRILEKSQQLGSITEGWAYDERNGLLFMKLKQINDKISINISDPQLEYVPQLSRTVEKIDWHFSEGGLRDWAASNDLKTLRIRDGLLVTQSTGSDPYMVSIFTKIDATVYPEIVIRMRTTAGRHAQIFWSTNTSYLGEATSISFEIISDGEFHDYIIQTGNHAKWKGNITSLRLDPTDSGGSEIAVESIIGGR